MSKKEKVVDNIIDVRNVRDWYWFMILFIILAYALHLAGGLSWII